VQHKQYQNSDFPLAAQAAENAGAYLGETMNCHQAKNAMVVAVYATLKEGEENALKEHISRCRKCAKRWERTAHLRTKTARIPAFPVPDPDRSWAVISERLSKRHRLPVRRRHWQWVPAAAVLLLVFAAGIYLGRRVFFDPAAAQIQSPLDLSSTSLESYADYLQPVLVDFLNRNGVQNPESMRQLERRIVSDLLDRTRLLKSFIPEDGSPILQDLFQDLEFILTAMDNLEAGDRNTARHLVGLIREKEISFRLRQLISTQSTL
jgi:hypothetical protein